MTPKSAGENKLIISNATKIVLAIVAGYFALQTLRMGGKQNTVIDNQDTARTTQLENRALLNQLIYKVDILTSKFADRVLVVDAKMDSLESVQEQQWESINRLYTIISLKNIKQSTQ